VRHECPCGPRFGPIDIELPPKPLPPMSAEDVRMLDQLFAKLSNRNRGDDFLRWADSTLPEAL
jgi:hypothetical protein